MTRAEELQDQIKRAEFTLSLYEEEYEGKRVSPYEIERWDAENYREDIEEMKKQIAGMKEELAKMQ